MSDPWQPPLVADLATLKLYVGARTATDDDLLAQRLSAATQWVQERTMESRWAHSDLQEAILLLASRLYKRRQSPEGVAGFGTEGIVVRIRAELDPDVRQLLDRHLDMANVGVG